jgi:hypothetical protein
MTLGEILFLLAVGGAAGYYVHAAGIDKKAVTALNSGLDSWTRRSAQIMLQEIDFTFPADAKLDELAST